MPPFQELPQLSEGIDLLPDRPFAGGTRLKVPLLGVSLQLPADLTGGVPSQGRALLMRPADQRGLGIVVLQTGGSADELRWLLSQPADLSEIERGVVLLPSAMPVTRDSTISNVFGNGVIIGHAAAALGPSGNFALVSFIGPLSDDARLRKYTADVVSSLQFAKPRDAEVRAQWLQGLRGNKLQHMDYKASKGYSGASWDSTHYHTLHLGSDMTYLYEHRHEGSSNVTVRDSYGNTQASGGHASQSGDVVQGTWRIEIGLTYTLLILRAQNGGVSTWYLTFDGRVRVNGTDVSISKSEWKN